MGAVAHVPDRLTHALTQYRKTASIPIPLDYADSIGDGDYRSIGEEFLERVVRQTDLKPESSILDLGCGLGRLAQPMRYFLNDEGRFLGIDIVKDSICWCSENIGNHDKRFTFKHLDIRHPLYNPLGTLEGDTVDLPIASESFDVVTMISVFTHLSAEVSAHYLKEIDRVLRVGGKLFATFFAITKDEPSQEEASNRLAFDCSKPGPVFVEEGDEVFAAVAFDSEWLLKTATQDQSFRLVSSERGHWRYQVPPAGTPYQDIKVYQKW